MMDSFDPENAGSDASDLVATGIHLSVFLAQVPMDLIERTAQGFKGFGDFMGCGMVVGLRNYLVSILDLGESDA